MASGTLTSRILGLFRDMALAALFDRAITDAWTAAFRLPNLFRRLFGEGSLSVSFIPVFMEAKSEDASGVRAQNLINALYTVLLIFLGSLTVLGIIFMEQVLGVLLTSQYMADTERWLLTVRMARLMFGFVYFVCSYAYFMGILNALGSFGLPAVAPALLNISMLVFTFMPPSWFAQAGDGLAWGVLVGGVLQSLVLWLALKARGYLPRLQFAFKNSDLKKVLVNMVPGLLGMGLLQLTTLVNLHFASALGQGAISYIYWADRLLELPLSLVSISLGAALLPTLSDLYIRKEHSYFADTLQKNFLFTFFLAWPAALGLFFLSQPIVEVLFKRGAFSDGDARATAIVLQVYALNLLFVSGVRIIAPAFYAVKNTWLPAVAAVLSLVLHIAWAPWWISRAGLQGLVVSSLCAVIVQFVVMMLAMHFMVTKIKWLQTSAELGKMFLAGCALVGAVQIYAVLEKAGVPSQLVNLALAILLGAGAYTVVALGLRLEQARLLWAALRRKF
ncbi:murein biosynthesis integral membrane protein MurJ [Bdellovibrio sp. NC01]|nr:murein biosynthesis integral membrane protein MurJ [Bdellovibrio sp. NC01]